MNHPKLISLLILILAGCANHLQVDEKLQICAQKTENTLASLVQYNQLPRSINKNDKNWSLVGIDDWTSGFWPGILWYVYEYTHDEKIREKADKFSMALRPLSEQKAMDHDLGFMMYCSLGNGYRLTKDTVYKKILLRTADSLATLFNPKVGTILSWPRMVTKMGWPHNTIIDNMMNLKLLFWASKNGGRKELYDMAVSHANKTMQNHFRSDYSSYHVVVYDTVNGKMIKGVTHQGVADNSMWARGQAWAIYGFTMCYRETKDKTYLDFAQKLADVYLKRLPKDFVPYWDFDDPDIPKAPKDASAAAITASALLEMSVLIADKTISAKYLDAAKKMLESLSSPNYFAGNQNQAFLLHSTGNMPVKGEVDASIIYADYYYIEALLRLKKIENF
jgi:unsaturated chondroitin disaccharide hydrolase